MFQKINYSDTGAGLPWEVRFDYLRGNGWSTSEIIVLEKREEEEAKARKATQEARQPKEGAHAKNHTKK
ncbi:MAG: hypothetical protein GY726_13490 [Proteobacteria bacterium]|nr:hypothetical protein [Pseudomonadota bacterium]MCP4935933.1 hypothetical protein [bacterium]